MELSLEWGKPLILKKGVNDPFYSVDLSNIPTTPGVYVFYRVHGDTVRALYVGKTTISLKQRIEQQLDTVSLMKGIKNAGTGSKFVVFGEFKPKSGQRKNCLGLIERGLMRYFLAQPTEELLNIQGNRILKHSLTSERMDSNVRRMIPPDIVFEH
jgi:hypothetical protein